MILFLQDKQILNHWAIRKVFFESTLWMKSPRKTSSMEWRNLSVSALIIRVIGVVEEIMLGVVEAPQSGVQTVLLRPRLAKLMQQSCLPQARVVKVVNLDVD
jgi:hypothetical protein